MTPEREETTTETKLKRLFELRELQYNYLAEGDEVAAFSDEIMNEYSPLQEQLAEHYLPLMKQLCDAGLINVEVETEHKVECFETRFCYKNGNMVFNVDGEDSVMEFDKDQLDEKEEQSSVDKSKN